ncbi:hypothetical protein CHH83_09075 [Bacillus sp. 7586-K]|nr:hypothetical protein CHH83_09075 [Bacillus sp. 7586-K]
MKKMLFCNECGTQLKEGAAFCPSCGTVVKGQAPATTQISQQPVPAQKMAKKTKMLLIGIGAAVILLFGAYKTGETLTDKNRMIESFEKALIDGDQKKVAKLLHSDDPQLTISESSVKGFVSYYKKHPDEVSDLIDNLEEQSKYLDNHTYRSSNDLIDFFAEGNLDNGVINLKKDGKTALFFDKYTLEVEEVFVTITTNYKDTQLSFDGKEIGKADEDDFQHTYGPYLPGNYKVQATLKTDFVDLKKSENISLVNSGNEVELDMYLDGEDVTVNLDSFDPSVKATLFIDGKDVKINPIETPTFGPVLVDGTMNIQVEATLPWGKVKTAEIPITDREVPVNLGQSSELQDAIFNQIATYSTENLVAFTTGSTNKLTTVTDSYKDVIAESIAYSQEMEQYYKGQYLGTIFALDSLNVYFSEDKWVADVEVLQSYNEGLYYEGVTPELEKVEVNRRYSLEYNEKQKKWLINGMESSFGYGTDHVKEIKEKDPKMYQTNWGNSTISTEASTDKIASFVEEYMYASVAAINAEDFSLVEGYIDPSGKKYNEQKEYTTYLNEKGITEDLLSIEIEEVKKLDDTTYQVTSFDEYTIYQQDGSEEDASYKTVQIVKILPDGSFGINELISTDKQ